MGHGAACVDTMELLMKSWITPHLFRVQLTGGEGWGGVVCVCVCVCVCVVCVCVKKGICHSVGGYV